MNFSQGFMNTSVDKLLTTSQLNSFTRQSPVIYVFQAIDRKGLESGS